MKSEADKRWMQGWSEFLHEDAQVEREARLSVARETLARLLEHTKDFELTEDFPYKGQSLQCWPEQGLWPAAAALTIDNTVLFLNELYLTAMRELTVA